MTTAIVIKRKLSNIEIHEIEQLLIDYPQTVVYSEGNIPKKLNHVNSLFLELDPKEKKRINFQVMDQVLAFGETVITDKTITDMLTFGKASIWHYHKFRIYFHIRNYIYDLTMLQNIASKNDKVFYFGSNKLLANNPQLTGKIVPSVKPEEKAGTSYRGLFGYSLFFISRIMFGLFYNKNVKNKKHLLIDHAQKQTCFNFTSLKPKKDNYNLDYLFDRIDDDFGILDEIEIIKPSAIQSSLFKKYNFFKNRKRNYFFSENILLRELISKGSIKRRKNNAIKLLNIYSQIASHVDDPVQKMILSSLRSLHQSSLYYLFKYRAYQRFFKKHRFQTVSSIDENSPRIKTILDAAKSIGIKTVGIQHGAIHNLHPAYMFTNRDKKRKIATDYTLVWGVLWKKILMEEGNYPDNSVFITGQIRTDIIPKLREQFETAEQKIVQPGKKSLLFASQPQRDPQLRKQAAEDVFITAKTIDNVHLTVKLHPAEKNDFDYYSKIARSVGCTNYDIIYHAELYELLAIADIVITCFSTVGAEAIYFDKPLVILDHLMQDIQNYHKEGIAFQARNSKELVLIVKDILGGNKRIDKEAYTRYVKKVAYKVDGKAGERAVKFIKNL